MPFSGMRCFYFTRAFCFLLGLVFPQNAGMPCMPVWRVWFGLAWLVWFGLAWLGWFGLVWLGLAWLGLVWFGLVWLVGWLV